MLSCDQLLEGIPGGYRKTAPAFERAGLASAHQAALLSPTGSFEPPFLLFIT